MRTAAPDTGGIDVKAGDEVVAAVEHDICLLHLFQQRFACQSCLDGGDLNVGINRVQGLACGVGLRPAQVFPGVQQLALQVREIDGVRIRDDEMSDPRRGKVHGSR